MAEVAWKFREVSSSKHTKCCLDKYNLIFPLLRFGALIILLRKTFRYAVNDLVLDWSKNWQVKSRVLMNFIFWLNTKFSRDLFVTSWACTIGIWSKLTYLDWLDKFTRYVIIFFDGCFFNSIKKGIENRGVLNLNGKRYHDIFHILNIKTKAINIEVNFRRFWCIDDSIFFNVLNRVVWKHEDFFFTGSCSWMSFS